MEFIYVFLFHCSEQQEFILLIGAERSAQQRSMLVPCPYAILFFEFEGKIYETVRDGWSKHFFCRRWTRPSPHAPPLGKGAESHLYHRSDATTSHKLVVSSQQRVRGKTNWTRVQPLIDTNVCWQIGCQPVLPHNSLTTYTIALTAREPSLWTLVSLGLGATDLITSGDWTVPREGS